MNPELTSWPKFSPPGLVLPWGPPCKGYSGQVKASSLGGQRIWALAKHEVWFLHYGIKPKRKSHWKLHTPQISHLIQIKECKWERKFSGRWRTLSCYPSPHFNSQQEVRVWGKLRPAICVLVTQTSMRAIHSLSQPLPDCPRLQEWAAAKHRGLSCQGISSFCSMGGLQGPCGWRSKNKEEGVEREGHLWLSLFPPCISWFVDFSTANFMEYNYKYWSSLLSKEDGGRELPGS